MGWLETDLPGERICLVPPLGETALTMVAKSKRHCLEWHSTYTVCWIPAENQHLQVKWRYEGRQFSAQPGSCMVMQPGCLHRTIGVSNETNFSVFHWTSSHVRKVAEALGIATPINIVEPCSTSPLLCERLAELQEALLQCRGQFEFAEIEQSALEALILASSEARPSIWRDAFRVEVRRACAFIQDNYGRSITYDELQKAVGLSCERLRHVFQLQVGVTPHQYLLMIRLGRAREQLRKAKSRNLSRLAADLGFCDLAHFSKQFKRYSFGLAPSRWAPIYKAFQI